MKAGKMIRLVVALSLVLMVFAGCSSKTKESTDETMAPATAAATAEATVAPSAAPTEAAVEKPDISKEVKLKLVILGDKPQDTDLVYEEINKKLKQDINATVELEVIGWGDVFTKIPLMLASGEDFDVIATANWNNYFSNSRSGAYKEITKEDMAKYAPQTLANTPEEVFNSALVDGKLYALPMNYHEITTYGYVVRGDLMKKYNIPDIKSMDDFGVYLDAIKKNEKSMVPWDTNNNSLFAQEQLAHQANIYNPDGTPLGLNIDDAKPKLTYLYDTPAATDFFKKMKEWSDKGYWTKGALVNKIASGDSFKSGKSAASFENLTNANSLYQSLQATHADWDVRFYPTNPDKKYLANPFINNGMAINAKAKNPERALMMLDLFRNDVSYYNLTTYGIKGKHYDITADNKLTSLPESANFPPSGAYPYGWMDDRFFLSPGNGLPNYSTVIESVKGNLKQTNIRDFTADHTAFKSIDAGLADINAQYLVPLFFGIVKDSVEKDLQTVKEKMTAVGLDTMTEDMQKQLDAFTVVIK